MAAFELWYTVNSFYIYFRSEAAIKIMLKSWKINYAEGKL